MSCWLLNSFLHFEGPAGIMYRVKHQKTCTLQKFSVFSNICVKFTPFKIVLSLLFISTGPKMCISFSEWYTDMFGKCYPPHWHRRDLFFKFITTCRWHSLNFKMSLAVSFKCSSWQHIKNSIIRSFLTLKLPTNCWIGVSGALGPVLCSYGAPQSFNWGSLAKSWWYQPWQPWNSQVASRSASFTWITFSYCVEESTGKNHNGLVWCFQYGSLLSKNFVTGVNECRRVRLMGLQHVW